MKLTHSYNEEGCLFRIDCISETSQFETHSLTLKLTEKEYENVSKFLDTLISVTKNVIVNDITAKLISNKPVAKPILPPDVTIPDGYSSVVSGSVKLRDLYLDENNEWKEITREDLLIYGLLVTNYFIVVRHIQ